MALVNMGQMLRHAKENKYAVGNFDVFNIEMLKGVIEGAEETKSPVIIAYGEVFIDYISIESFTAMVVEMAKDASVPVALHLDHAVQFETIVRAAHAGFTSVMIDASDKSLEENIAITKKVVELCRVFDVSVEAEVGHVSGLSGMYENDDYMYTSVEEAKTFVEQTGVDALAIAIGTVHGVYKEEPKLNFERIREISDAIDVPLVLHGASGLADEDIKKTVDSGIQKVNVFTDLMLKSMDAIRENISNQDISLMELCDQITHATKQEVIKNIIQFGSSNMAG